MTSPIPPPSPEEHTALLRAIGPLPLAGQAWPDWVRILTWVILAVLSVQVVTTAIRAPDHAALSGSAARTSGRLASIAHSGRA